MDEQKQKAVDEAQAKVDSLTQQLSEASSALVEAKGKAKVPSIEESDRKFREEQAALKAEDNKKTNKK